MKNLRLKALDHPAPTCASFTDELAVRRYERAVREHRAWAEAWVITPLDGRIDGAFRVQGAGGTYLVDVVDGSLEADCCTCPDFLTNELGTCKHLEAVRRALSRTKKSRAEWSAIGTDPARPTVAVMIGARAGAQDGVKADASGGTSGGVRLVTRGRWSKALLAEAGLVERLDGALWPAAPGWPQGVPPKVRVTHAAVIVAERVRAAHAVAERSTRVARAIARGKLGTDVLRVPLFAYQRTGVEHLVTAGRALLADDMGLGKTVQTIAACEVLAARGEADRVLVVTPASLKDQWAREIERLTGGRADIVGGSGEQRRAALASGARYKIVNYELTWRELTNLQSLGADVLVLDEAQRARNFRTKTAVTLRAIPSKFLFVLTGTPVENRLDDLYSLAQLVDPSLLGPLWRFNFAFHDQNERGRVTGAKNLAQLRERLAPVVMRRRKEDVLAQLPPLTQQTRYVALTDEQQRLESGYRSAAAGLLAIAERRALTPQEQQRLMKALLKARQACDAAELCDPSTRSPGSPKLDELESIVEEIVAQGAQKILIFSEWVEMLKLAAARLDRLGVGHRMLHGGVPADRRPALLAAFRDDPDARVLLSSDAGGVGLNLQVASYVVHLDLPWNPARLDQRTARAHRLGQTRGVTVVTLCARDGIERGIEGTLAGKRSLRVAALEPGSEVDRVEAQSFGAFLHRMRDVLVGVDAGQVDGPPEGDAHPETTPLPPLTHLPDDPDALPLAAIALEGATLAPAPPHDASQGVEPRVDEGARAVDHEGPRAGAGEVDLEPTASAPQVVPETRRTAFASEVGGTAPPRARRAPERVRLARVVLDAGFAADAARAAYEALAAVLADLLEGPAPRDHGALVAAVYRQLIPTGKAPQAAHGALARLHDLASLEAHGVDIEPQTAREAVDEAEAWVERLGAAAP